MTESTQAIDVFRVGGAPATPCEYTLVLCSENFKKKQWKLLKKIFLSKYERKHNPNVSIIEAHVKVNSMTTCVNEVYKDSPEGASYQYK